MPWKNGQGKTIELLKKNIANSDKFLWRLSMADVTTDGPFSNFSGYNRTLVLLSGHGMTLEHEHSARNELRQPLQCATFAGDENTVAMLHNGPIVDFNIMTRSGDCQAVVKTAASEQLIPESGDEIFIYAVGSSLTIKSATQQTTLEPKHLLRVNERDAKMTCSGGPSIVVIIKYTNNAR